MQDSHTAHDLHSLSKNAAVSGATAPKPPTNIGALIARFILTQMPARGEAAFRSGRSGARLAEPGDSQPRLLPVTAGIIVPEFPETQEGL
ncbi:MAG: hypothetical protein DMG85_13445 [Acidobacteria bacterium]|nr:MAG: hypothetical protein DMG85_13445 [Acidobacteriota bacterium]